MELQIAESSSFTTTFEITFLRIDGTYNNKLVTSYLKVVIKQIPPPACLYPADLPMVVCFAVGARSDFRDIEIISRYDVTLYASMPSCDELFAAFFPL